MDDGSLSEQNNASIEEVWRAFSALIALTTAEQRKTLDYCTISDLTLRIQGLVS